MKVLITTSSFGDEGIQTLQESGIDEFFPFTLKNISNEFSKISEKYLSQDAVYTCWIKRNY